MNEQHLTVGDVAGLIQDVADSVAALMDLAVFPHRIHSQDDDAFPEHARYLLAMHNLADAFGLSAARRRGGRE